MADLGLYMYIQHTAPPREDFVYDEAKGLSKEVYVEATDCEAANRYMETLVTLRPSWGTEGSNWYRATPMDKVPQDLLFGWENEFLGPWGLHLDPGEAVGFVHWHDGSIQGLARVPWNEEV